MGIIAIIKKNQSAKDLLIWESMLSANKKFTYLKPFIGIFEYIYQDIKLKINNYHNRINLESIRKIIFKDIPIAIQDAKYRLYVE